MFISMMIIPLSVFTCQVSQLYDMVQQWDAMSTSIPQVVQRLVAVKELHEQGNTLGLKPIYKVVAQDLLCGRLKHGAILVFQMFGGRTDISLSHYND